MCASRVKRGLSAPSNLNLTITRGDRRHPRLFLEYLQHCVRSLESFPERLSKKLQLRKTSLTPALQVMNNGRGLAHVCRNAMAFRLHVTHLNDGSKPQIVALKKKKRKTVEFLVFWARSVGKRPETESHKSQISTLQAWIPQITLEGSVGDTQERWEHEENKSQLPTDF